MDNNILVSLVNTLKQTKEKVSSRTSEADGELFTQILSEKSKEKGEKTESMITGQEKTEKEKARDEAVKLRGKTFPKQAELSPLLNYLYNLVLKNPDALSLGEKSALGLDAEGHGVGIQEFQKMLSQRNLNLRELSFSQLAQLTQRSTRGQINAFLDEIVRLKKDGAPEATIRGIEVAKKGEVEIAAKAAGAAVPEETAVKREEVIQQIIQHLELKNIADRSELSIRLNPAFLGELKLNIVKDGGKLSIRFQTTSRKVRSIIQESIEELSGALQSKGITVSNIGVNLVEEMA